MLREGFQSISVWVSQCSAWLVATSLNLFVISVS